MAFQGRRTENLCLCSLAFSGDFRSFVSIVHAREVAQVVSEEEDKPLFKERTAASEELDLPTSFRKSRQEVQAVMGAPVKTT